MTVVDTAIRRAPQRLIARRLALSSAALALTGVFIVWALESWLVLVWLQIDTRPPRWDESVLLQITEAWRTFFVHPSLSALHTAATTQAWKTAPFWLAVMGFVEAELHTTSVDVAAWASSALSLGLIMAATYGIGHQLYGRLAACLAAMLVGVYAGIQYLSHLYLLHVPLVAMVTVAMWGLTRLLRPRVRTFDVLLAAVLMGLACFTRYQAAFFLWLPAGWVLLRRFQLDRANGASRWLAMRQLLVVGGSLALGSLLLLSAFVYINRGAFLDTFSRFVTAPKFESYAGAAQYDGPALTWFSIGWYARTWATFDLMGQPVLLGLLAIGVVGSALWFRSAAIYLLSWVAGGYFVLWLLVNKEAGYDLPLLPAFALLSTSTAALFVQGAATWSRRWLPVGLALGLGLYMLASLGWYGFGLEQPLATAGLLEASLQRRAGADLMGPDKSLAGTLYRPAADDWQNDAILQQLEQLRSAYNLEHPVIAFVPNIAFLQVDSFRYKAQIASLPFTFETTNWDLASQVSRDVLLNSDMVVAKTGQTSVVRDGTDAAEAFALAMERPEDEFGRVFQGRFAAVGRLPLPDDTNAIVYMRRARMVPMDGIRDLNRATIQAGDPTYVTHVTNAFDGRTREGVFEHPPATGYTSVAYPVRPVPEGARLTFAVGLLPESWDKDGDGVEFRVVVVDGLQTRIAWDEYMDPKHRTADRHLDTVSLDLADYAGREIEVRLETGPGPVGDNTADWAVWIEPLVTGAS